VRDAESMSIASAEPLKIIPVAENCEKLSPALEGSDGEPVSVGLKYGRKGKPEHLKELTGNFQISFLFFFLL
jgi:hypothetical protein